MSLLVAENIRKVFGSTLALDGASLTVEPGEVHGLIGSNGCGKSTLCKIAVGSVGADEGHLRFDGREGFFGTPAAAAAAGIAVFYQELSLIPDLDVAENIALGHEPGRRGMVDGGAIHREGARLLARFGSSGGKGLTPGALVRDLSADQRQIAEICKILARAPKLVIFDEATSSLDGDQVQIFFEIVRELREAGTGIIFISHRMDELFAICDRITVMRDGRTEATLPVATTDREAVLTLMVGSALATRHRDEAPPRPGAPVLEVAGLSNAVLRDVSFTLHEGEILGLGGLHGQGQSAVLRAIFGADPSSGSVRLGGMPHARRSPAAAIRAGLGYVSGDRGINGVFLDRPILENMAIAHLSKSRAAVFRPRAFVERVAGIVARLNLRFAGYDFPLRTLSGGNQQKVVIARWLATGPRVLLLDDPTKGIDVEAKADLYAIIDELAAEGVAILLHSSEDEELLSTAHRVLVFGSGRIRADLAGEALTPTALYRAAYEVSAA